MKKLKMIGIGLILLALHTANYAQPPKLHERHETAELFDDHGRRPEIPNLSEEQEKKILNLRMALFEEIQPLRNQVNEKRARLRTLSDSDNVDRKQVEKLVIEIGEINTKIELAQINHRLDMNATLTADQRVFLMRHLDRNKRH